LKVKRPVNSGIAIQSKEEKNRWLIAYTGYLF
jgi:hypothetical protein